MEVTVAVICLAVFLYICYKFMKPERKSKLPPGPSGVPIFGNVLQFGNDKRMLKMSDAGRPYGDAYTVKLFHIKAVVLNSFDIVKEAFCFPKYANLITGRPPNFAGSYVSPAGVIFVDYCDEWTALRKVAMRGLRTYGTHLKDIEDLVQGELEHFIRRLDNEQGKSVNPVIYISGYITSILSMLITGRHLKHDHEQLKLIDSITFGIIYFLSPGISELMTACPWLRHIPIGFGKVYRNLQRNIDTLMKSINQERLNPDSERRYCFLDYVLEEEGKGHINDKAATGVMLDLLFGGTGTSTTSLNIMILVLVGRPDIQKRIQDEVDEVVGKEKLPCADDKNSMPYTQAFMWETFRQYPAVPIPVPRSTMADVELRDYYLPKDTMVFYNTWKIHHDEFWDEPWEFKPSRFLDNEGKLVPPEDEKRQRILTFGIGKRLCIGEVLARLRIFLALAAVVQKFNLLPDPEQPVPDLDPRTFDLSGLLQAHPFKMQFQTRDT